MNGTRGVSCKLSIAQRTNVRRTLQVGGYEAGARAGRGLYIFPNGDRYEGGVAADLPQGAGVYHFAAGNARLEGAWLAGRCHGWGLLTLGERQIYGALPWQLLLSGPLETLPSLDGIVPSHVMLLDCCC